jgi:hypothetical protein
MMAYWNGIPGKGDAKPSPELDAFIDSLDCRKGPKTRLRYTCKSYGITEIYELRDNLENMLLLPNMGHRTIKYVRIAFGILSTINGPLAARLSVGG